jgi:predicted RNase H-like HicB family nuclease
MKREFTQEFWQGEGWFVGRLKEVPGVFSQGETLKELGENTADAYELISQEGQAVEHAPAQTKGIVLDVA